MLLLVYLDRPTCPESLVASPTVQKRVLVLRAHGGGGLSVQPVLPPKGLLLPPTVSP